jgi:hypothetical protein
MTVAAAPGLAGVAPAPPEPRRRRLAARVVAVLPRLPFRR